MSWCSALRHFLLPGSVPLRVGRRTIQVEGHGKVVGTSSGMDGTYSFAMLGGIPRLNVISLFVILVVPWDSYCSRVASAMGLGEPRKP